ncbi:hypothetical protein O1611_g7348 [Lasiodiplodia mahajangana]|uniref:Uncharacterized protein n=1 Tax=Lasiodiplodia mahajangana TaxID=1108764 RepID=A0ACC2JFJ9_9PEZI|nr:hypothetical protein O1611_g7348 [Lasiodiplodia mahajangana]
MLVLASIVALLKKCLIFGAHQQSRTIFELAEDSKADKLPFPKREGDEHAQSLLTRKRESRRPVCEDRIEIQDDEVDDEEDAKEPEDSAKYDEEGKAEDRNE